MKKAGDWRKAFEAAMKAAAAKAGEDVTGLAWEGVCTDRTWGDRCGLVFYGASDAVCERAARFFEKWASKYMRKMGAVGGYDTQESIGYCGRFSYTAFDNGAKGWWKGETARKVGEASDNGPTCTEVRSGYATSYVYYPCAD